MVKHQKHASNVSKQKTSASKVKTVVLENINPLLHIYIVGTLVYQITIFLEILRSLFPRNNQITLIYCYLSNHNCMFQWDDPKIGEISILKVIFYFTKLIFVCQEELHLYICFSIFGFF